MFPKQKQVNKLRTQMREMGSVNVESINEYKNKKNVMIS